MTGSDHYLAAERLMDPNPDQSFHSDADRFAAAQVHATLALAAATALNDGKFGQHDKAWQRIALGRG